MLNNAKTKNFIASHVIHVKKSQLFGYILKRNFWNRFRESAKRLTTIPTNSTTVPKRGIVSAYKDSYTKVKKQTTTKENIVENSDNIEQNTKTVVLENNKDGYMPHAQILTDALANDPESLDVVIPKVGITHKIPNKDFIKKNNLPDIVETAPAGISAQNKPHNYVLWDETTTVREVLKKPKNEAITTALNKDPTYAQKGVALFEKGRKDVADKIYQESLKTNKNAAGDLAKEITQKLQVKDIENSNIEEKTTVISKSIPNITVASKTQTDTTVMSKTETKTAETPKTTLDTTSIAKKTAQDFIKQNKNDET